MHEKLKLIITQIKPKVEEEQNELQDQIES